ncbi:MAG: glycosyl hydrolase family 28 protein [Chitinophagales bacterium]
MRLLFLFYLLLATVLSGFSQVFSVTAFGAVGDSITLNTVAIQAAIDSCHNSGGGKVVIPSGIFLSGTIRMKSDVELQIDSGGVLKGSANLNDYPIITPLLRTYADEYVQRSLVYAEGVRNIAFTGKGRVNGNGLAPVFINSSNRVFGFRIYTSSNVRYEDLTLQNSAFWMMHNCNLDTMLVRNITITNHCYGNQDGVNIDMCRNVLVENCDIDGNNDPIVMKAMAPLFTQNVEVRNCTLATYSRAIKIGTETQGFFSNIYVHDCVVKKSVRGPLNLDAKCGINLAIVDGGGMENIRIENIQLEAITPIAVRLGNRAQKYMPSAPVPGVGYARDIVLKNITATAKSNTTSHITGIPNHSIENIRLENVAITIPGGMDSLPGWIVPENESSKPEHDIFGDTIPAYGLFLRHLKNIQLCDVSITALQPDNRPRYIQSDVVNLDTVCINGLAELMPKQVVVFPNPAHSYIQVAASEVVDDTVRIWDAVGKLMLQTKARQIDVAEWKAGVYIVQIGNAVQRFVKQ